MRHSPLCLRAHLHAEVVEGLTSASFMPEIMASEDVIG